MAARKRWRGTTKARGYGHEHQRERKRRLKAWRAGDLCAHCGHPIVALWRTAADGRTRITLVDLPHTSDRTGYLPGLAHTYCNRADGAVRRNRMRAGGSGGTWRTARAW